MSAALRLLLFAASVLVIEWPDGYAEQHEMLDGTCRPVLAELRAKLVNSELERWGFSHGPSNDLPSRMSCVEGADS